MVKVGPWALILLLEGPLFYFEKKACEDIATQFLPDQTLLHSSSSSVPWLNISHPGAFKQDQHLGPIPKDSDVIGLGWGSGMRFLKMPPKWFSWAAQARTTDSRNYHFLRFYM